MHDIEIVDMPALPPYLLAQGHTDTIGSIWAATLHRTTNKAADKALLYATSKQILNALGAPVRDVAMFKKDIPLKDLCRLFCRTEGGEPIVRLRHRAPPGSWRIRVAENLTADQMRMVARVARGIIVALPGDADMDLIIELLVAARTANGDHGALLQSLIHELLFHRRVPADDV
jgi:hypothetical protein